MKIFSKLFYRRFLDLITSLMILFLAVFITYMINSIFLSNSSIEDKKYGDPLSNYFFLITLIILMVIIGKSISFLIIRLFPIYVSGEKRKFTLLMLALIYTACIIFILYFYFGRNDIKYKNLFLFTNFFWIAIIFFVPVKRLIASGNDFKENYTLYLRHFASFEDNVVLEFLNNNIYARIIFLVGDKRQAINWSPSIYFTNIFSLPYVLKASDENWHEPITKLVQQAAYIILDISNVSNSTLYELNQLKNLGKLNKTLIIINTKSKTNVELIAEMKHKCFALMQYDIGYRTFSFIRVCTGIVLSSFVGLILGALCWLAIMYTVNFAVMLIIGGGIMSIGNSNIFDNDRYFNISLLLLLIFWILMSVWVYFKIYFRKNLSKTSKRSLKMILYLLYSEEIVKLQNKPWIFRIMKKFSIKSK